MPTDFSQLVLGPAMAAFARPVMITPSTSQPFSQPYPAKGIWTADSAVITTELGGQIISFTLTFGIRLSDFTIAPKSGDVITTAGSDLPLGYPMEEVDPTSTIDFSIQAFTPDGQGGARLLLNRVI